MKIVIYYQTLKYLRLRQIYFQSYYRIRKIIRNKLHFVYLLAIFKDGKTLLLEPFITKTKSFYDLNKFTFLNQITVFSNWNDEKYGKLWSYNLNYMDYLLQEGMPIQQGRDWINRFIAEIENNKNGLEPYPIALRGMNWIKFISLNINQLTAEEKKKWDASLFAQYKILIDNLEYHLLGNHLLEDAFSLLWGAVYFSDKSFYSLADRLLKCELKEQVLKDGAHYELSPMYHCILLDRLLDCINLLANNKRFEQQMQLHSFLCNYAVRMLGWLETIIYKDRDIPLVNDATNGIAPKPAELFAYAHRLNLCWRKSILLDSGYRKFVGDVFELFIDIGKIGPDYIPGHAHADTFNYELRIKEKPFIVDTSISTYNKNEQRQYERGTEAHNTVTVDGLNSSIVWGGFRVAKRAKVTELYETESTIYAKHDGYAGGHSRSFSFSSDRIIISDSIKGDKTGHSYIHFHPDVDIISCMPCKVVTSLGSIEIENALTYEIEECFIAFEYNRLVKTKRVNLFFLGKVTYTII